MAKKTSNQTIVSVTLDNDVKQEADYLFHELGLDLSTAINIFIRQCIRDGKIPFQISLNLPSPEAMAGLFDRPEFDLAALLDEDDSDMF